MNKNIVVAFILLISNINASENDLCYSSNYNMKKCNTNYNIQQIKQINCDVFKLNYKIQDFVIENTKNKDNAIASNLLQDLSINSIIFSLLIYDKNFHKISMYTNNIKNILSNLLSKQNLNNNILDQINKAFLSICNALYNNKYN